MNKPLRPLIKYLSSLLLLGLLLGTFRAQAQVDTYQFAASTSPFTPLPATATPVTGIYVDDAVTGQLPIGFTFVYDGTPYTLVTATSNGWLSFNPGATSQSGFILYDNLLDSNGNSSIKPLVAPLWDDLTGTGGTAAYQLTGTAPNRVFTFEWLDWRRLGATGAQFSIQVKLFETTNVVQYRYRQEATTLTGATASIGLAGAVAATPNFLSLSDATANPTVSSTIENNMISTAPPTNQVYQFTPPVPSACPTPRNLTANVSGTSATVNWTITTGGGSFTVIYGPTGFDPMTGGTSIGPLTGTTTTITNLIPGSYQFYVRQNCGGTAGNSNLSSAGGFSVPCPTPSALTATNLTNTTATLSWTSPITTGATFTVIYGPSGFDPATGGTRVTNLTGTSYTLTTLTPATNYQFYVLQVCLGGGTSISPGGPVSFTTPLTAPNNDEPCGAVVLGNSSVSGTNSGATTSLQNGINLPACSPSQVPKDVWYTIVPSGNSTTLTLAGTSAGMVRVFESPDCAGGLFNQVFCQSSGTNNTTVGVVNVTGLTPGARYYVAVSGYGSSDTPGSFTIVGTNLLASRAQAETNALLVYPNPSSTGQLTLRLDGFHGKGQASLLNALGQVVLTKALDAGTTEQVLSTRALAAGLYTLRVQIGQEVFTRKVVLE
jgi:hypothetical protein